MFFRRMPGGQALHLRALAVTPGTAMQAAELSLTVFIIRGTTDCTRVMSTLGTVDTRICASWICELNSALEDLDINSA